MERYGCGWIAPKGKLYSEGEENAEFNIDEQDLQDCLKALNTCFMRRFGEVEMY